MKTSPADIILDILFPRFCQGCGKEGRYVCNKCQFFISEAEPLYNLECLNGLTNVWEYEGLIKKLIQMIKYQAVTDIIKELISSIHIEIYYPYISYVPMFLKREKQRGFNQAKLIAKELSSNNNAELVSLIEKIKETRAQTELSQKERVENVKNCFAVNKKELSSDMKEVVLVDDVFTTGGSLRKMIEVIRSTGAEILGCYVVVKRGEGELEVPLHYLFVAEDLL